MKKLTKTNALREAERAGVEFRIHGYENDGGPVDGMTVAAKLGVDPAQVYKTLVTKGAHDHYVFVIPVAKELDLKAAARAVGEKAVAMLPLSDLLKTTGYVRGGCSPVGMKKRFTTVIDESCTAQATILVSAGRIGTQMELAPAALLALINGSTAHITHD